MSERPTPETDAASWVETNAANALVLASFAAQLERERDEARDALRELRDALTEVMRVSAPHMKRVGDTHVIRFADATIQKAKEVLG